MYAITIDAPAGVAHVTLGGMMTVDEVERYIHDLRRALLENRVGANYAMVIDVSDCPIQSQEMMTAMGRHMAHMPKARALAVVVGGSLARMQVRRLFTQPYARVVATVEQGRAWVYEGTEPLAA